LAAGFDRSGTILDGAAMLVNGTSMLVGMVFGGLLGVMCRVMRVPVSDVRMVCCLFVVAGLMVLGSFAMMSCCLLVVFCRFIVMLCALVHCHDSLLFRG
jgi:hypothetical protein